MGNCLVSVHVTGAHHNSSSSDIDQLAAEFVDKLKFNGHRVTEASIVSGGDQDLLNRATRLSVKPD